MNMVIMQYQSIYFKSVLPSDSFTTLPFHKCKIQLLKLQSSRATFRKHCGQGIKWTGNSLFLKNGSVTYNHSHVKGISPPHSSRKLLQVNLNMQICRHKTILQYVNFLLQVNIKGAPIMPLFTRCNIGFRCHQNVFVKFQLKIPHN